MTLDQLAAALPALARLGVPSLIHAEDPTQLLDPSGDPREYATYLASRPSGGEAAAVEALCALGRETGAQIHVLHISSAEAVDALVKGPATMSGETCPHYLTFCAEEIATGATLFKCAPPIRSAEHRDALWQGLIDGSLAMVVSDHSPAPAEMKGVEDGHFARAWGGIGSLQLRLQATWTGAAERGVKPPQLTRWLASAPARLAGLDDRKGAIGPGMDADFVIWDPDGVTEVDGSSLEQRHPITPYEGMRLRGKVVATILGGKTVFDGTMPSIGNGRMLRRR